MQIKTWDVKDDDVKDPGRSTLLADTCRLVLSLIPILPRRMLLQTPSVTATTPMLRGVWGAALHNLDLDVYHTVFDVVDQKGTATPGYLIRPAPEDPEFAPAVEWFLIGNAIGHDRVLMRAWDVACQMGLGHDRRPFFVRRVITLGPDSQRQSRNTSWALDQTRWPLSGPEQTPCRLVFPAPLRLRRHGRLIERPTLPDIVVAAGRRVGAFVPQAYRNVWNTVSAQMLSASRSVPSGLWRGERLDLVRYSGRQRQELDIHGVCGSLLLPEGPSNLWPLLAAASWLHIGKGTIMGLGRMHVQPA